MSRLRLVYVLLALGTLLVYLPVRHYAFVDYDDPDYVTENPVVQAGLTWAGVKWAFTSLAYACNWHPLVWLSLMLDCQLFGLNAGWQHLVNVFFHAANAVLLFLLLLHLTGALWQSAFVAALFAWHPLRVESVAWVTERKDVLFLFFGLLSLLAYVRYARGVTSDMRPTARNHAVQSRVPYHTSRYFGLALLFFALGLMSKPMLVTLPFVFLLLDYWPLERVTAFKPAISTWSRLVFEKWPFFALAAASCVVTYIAQQRSHVDILQEPYSMRFRLGNAVIAYTNYLVKSVYPIHLAVIYPLPKEFSLLQVLAAAMPLLLISWLAWRTRRHEPYLLVGWLWFLGTLLPVMGLTQVGAGNAAMADRYTYFPQIGLLLGATFCIGHWAAKLRLKPMMTSLAAGIVLTGYLLLTSRQLQYWRNGEILFEHALAVTRNNPDAENDLGIALAKTGRPQEAIKHYQEALRLGPGYARTHNNLGVVLLQTGQPQEAIEHFQQALRLKPDDTMAHYNLGVALLQTGQLLEAMERFQAALRLKPDDALAHNNLGVALLKTGQLQEAIGHFQEALRLKPGFVAARNHLGDALINLGYVLFQMGQMNQATVRLHEGLQIRPDDAGAYNCLGFIFLRQGRASEAVANFQKALELQPNNVDAQKCFAWVLATCPDASVRNGARAVELAQQANQLSAGSDPAVLATLAAAYAESRRFPDAMTTAQKALELATTQTNNAVANALRTQMGFYQAGLPFRYISLTNALPAESRP